MGTSSTGLRDVRDVQKPTANTTINDGKLKTFHQGSGQSKVVHSYHFY